MKRVKSFYSCDTNRWNKLWCPHYNSWNDGAKIVLSKFSLRIKILIENLVKRIKFHCLESSHFFSKSKDMREKYFKVFSKSYKQKKVSLRKQPFLLALRSPPLGWARRNGCFRRLKLSQFRWIFDSLQNCSNVNLNRNFLAFQCHENCFVLFCFFGFRK